MTILAYLPASLLRHLQFVLGPDHAPLVAHTWSEIDEILQARPISAAVIDPSSGRSGGVEQLMISYPSLPIVAYVPLTPVAFTAISNLSQTGLKHVVLYLHDDAPQVLSLLLERLQRDPLSARILTDLEPRLRILPSRLNRAVQNLFAEPYRYANAQDIAAASRIPLVRVHRALREARLATPKTFFIAAKLLKAYSYLGDPAHSVHSVARKLGYRQTRILADHSNELLGLNPSRVRASLTEDQMVERILRSVRPEGGRFDPDDRKHALPDRKQSLPLTNRRPIVMESSG